MKKKTILVTGGLGFIGSNLVLHLIKSNYFVIILDKKTGDIIRITDIFKNFKQHKRENIRPTGFIVGLKNIYLSTGSVDTMYIVEQVMSKLSFS